MARSRNEISGTWPLIGTSDATSATAVGVVGAKAVAKKGAGKSGNPAVQPVGRRKQVKESSGARYAVTATRAYPVPAEGVGRNVHMMPSSHGQSDTWRTEFDGRGPVGE
jgi:hypothetical protein